MSGVNFGQYLKTMRQKRKLTLKELGDLTGLSHPYLSQIENGKRNPPSPEVLKSFAEPLGVMYTELMVAAGYWDEDELLEPIELGKDQNSREPQKKIIDLYNWLADEDEIVDYIKLKPVLNYKGQPLNQEDRKRILDMLAVLFPDRNE